MEFLPCGFQLCCHEPTPHLRSLEHRCVLADSVADKFLALVVTRGHLITLHPKHLEIEVNVKLLHFLKGVFTEVLNIFLPHVTYLLRLLPSMPHIDNFRSHHCPYMEIVDIVGIAFEVNTAAVHVKV